MEKNNEFFVPINEVSKQLDVPAHTLRYWEKQFASAIRPVTGAGNRRYYRRETIEKLREIKSLLYDRGMTIVGVKKMLHNGTFNDEKNIEKKPVNAGDFCNKFTGQNNDEIDSAIELLKRAKMFLE